MSALTTRFPLFAAGIICSAYSTTFSQGLALPESLQYVVRGAFENQVSSPTNVHPNVTTALQGMPVTANDGFTYLSEVSVGHTFAPYTAYGSYATDVANAVRAKLYPAPDATYTQVNKPIASGGAAFRYRVLLYNTDGTTDVTNHFEQMDQWYGNPERSLIEQQIRILRVALANAPYSAELRNLLLDAYTDRAVAEMQFVKQDLVAIARARLGLELVDQFIIDEEIRGYEDVTNKLKATLAQYRELLTFPQYGVRPDEIDPSALAGMNFGYYVFKQQQPKRNVVATRYFSGTGNTGPSNLPAPSGEPPRPVDEVLFEGYKDYSTILRLMGELTNHAVELNRLRGMRQLPNPNGDLEKARADIAAYMTNLPTDLMFLDNIFTNDTTFHPIQSVTSSTSATDLFPVGRLIEGPGQGFRIENGFPVAGTPWVTNAPGGVPSDYFEQGIDQRLVFDMGDDVELSQISIWGYPDETKNSVKRFRLRFATEADGPGGFATSVLFQPVYTIVNRDDRRQAIDFGTTIEARYVELLPLDNFYVDGVTGGDRVGLGEVAFERPALGPNDISGVAAARISIEQGLAGLVGVRSFLNGESNLLGLDPDFVVFLQNKDEAADSFEIFVDRVKTSGSNKPLTVALDKLAAAKTAYETFRESVDRVKEELSGIEATYKNRFYDITGFTPEEAVEIITDPGDPRFGEPRWDGSTPLPDSGADLDIVAENIRLLKQRLQTYEELKVLFAVAHEEADVTVSTARGLDDGIEEAKNEYLDKAGFYFDALAVSNAAAAGAQAATDTAFQTAGLDGVSTFFSAGGNAAVVLAAGAINTAAQAADAGLSRYFEKQIDAAAFAFQTTTQQQDNALTYQQALDAKQDLLREEKGAQAEAQELISALTQAQNRRGSLLAEVARIQRALQVNTERVRSTYYADPIHFIRSENALLEADSRFREAQRWLFLTQRALEHKWTQQFAIRSNGSEAGGTEKSYDRNTIFKLRNASELDDLLSAFIEFDNDRTIKFGQPDTTFRYSIISLKNNVLAPNPNRFNADPAKRADNGIRVDLATGKTVTQDELFRRKLYRLMHNEDGSPKDGMRIRINTAALNIPGLFNRTFYDSSTGKVNIPGEWRDKIITVKVSVLAPDATPNTRKTLLGSLSYGGLTIFRTPLIPLPQVENRLTLPNDAEDSQQLSYIDPDSGNEVFYTQELNVPGDIYVAPFRHFVPSGFRVDDPNRSIGAPLQERNIDKLFQASNAQLANANIAYWNRSITEIVPSDPANEDTLGSSFAINDFRELSVAATNWQLFLNFDQPALAAGFLDVNAIDDIEILVRHRADSRITPAVLNKNN